MRLATLHHKKSKFVMTHFNGPWTWMDYLDKLPKQWNMDKEYDTLNVKSLYMAGLLVSASKYKLDFVEVQEVR
jgi:hypothetical protein